jgi:hypothetical protein
MVIEGNAAKVRFLGSERIFRHPMGEWTTFTIPYSRITQVVYVGFLVVRVLCYGLCGLFGLCGLLSLVLGVRSSPVFFIGFIFSMPLILLIYILMDIFFSPKYLIVYELEGGKRSRLLLQVRPAKKRKEFAELLEQFRNTARGVEQTTVKVVQQAGPVQ